MRSKNFKVTDERKADFRHNAVCVGTGRMGLALQKEYFEQLKLVQEEIGFKWIRGHGLFHEDMAIYQESGYNFTYLDFVVDNYLSLNIRPFIELGFMPKKLASDEQACFYWDSNVTPPRDYAEWTALVKATLSHLIERYGADEVTAWPIEVWNEPNLDYFWKAADMQEYFKLFRETIYAVKEVDPHFRVGGPAIAGVDDERWMKEFLIFCRDEKMQIDFITRHLYTISPPEYDGGYGYPKLRTLANACGETEVSREIIDSFPEFRGMEMHVTEFNTSYTARSPLHDTNFNAAYIAFLLSKLGDDCASYSYWTFGDVFEEAGVPFTPFHGGFGLVANGLIKKPTFYAFKFFRDLGDGVCVHRSDEAVVLKKSDGSYRGVAWNVAAEGERDELELRFDFPGIFDGNDYCVVAKVVDEETCNPLKIWHDIGEPANPSQRQLALLRESAKPRVSTERGNNAAQQLAASSIEFKLAPNAVVYFEIFAAEIKSHTGFNYERAVRIEFDK